MKLIYLSRRDSRLRQIDFQQRGTLLVAATALCGVVAAVFFAGIQAGQHLRGTAADTHLAHLQAELAEQSSALDTLRAHTSDTMDALAMRIGQMNARVIRLDALGHRLTRMADLEDGEFDFSSVPGIGGPAEFVGDANRIDDVLHAIDELSAQLSDRETQLSILEHLMLDRNLYDRMQPKGRPVVSGWISSRFGRRTDPFTGKPAFHRGVDFAGREGSPVLAVADGVIGFAGSRRGYGRIVEINHGNGYVTRYAHNKKNLVEVGDTVAKGHKIALVGASGRATAPHVHFEVLRDGRPVDPLSYIRDNR